MAHSTDLYHAFEELYRNEINETHKPNQDDFLEFDGLPVASSTINITTTTLNDTQYINQRIHVPDGQTLEIIALGVQNASNQAPTDLYAEVHDETNGITLLKRNTKRTTEDGPLASVDGPVDVAFRIQNSSGNAQDATADFEIKMG